MKRASLSLAAILVLLAGCGGDKSSNVVPATGDELPQGSEPFELAPSEFTSVIDNRYWPMEPGTRWTYREVDEEGKALTVIVTATSETKKIANGITAIVVRDTVSEDGEVVEDTFDWYAQDADGNIWYMGEDTAEFEGGKVKTKEGSWEAGVDDALAGVAIPAQPEDNLKYRQEYYAGSAEDNGEVLAVDEQVEVPTGQYEHALLTKDTSTIEPGVVEFKFYAPGLGPVLALGISGGGGREELVKVEQVDAEAARAAATTPLGEKY